MKDVLTESKWVLVILALYLLLSLTYSIANPIFEASDEWSHYPFVEHIARGLGLPVQTPGSDALWRHEGSQPPLYYLLMGSLTGWIDTSDLPIIMAPNPHARIGIPLAQDNKNMIVHTARENWPWQGTVLAVHLARIASLLMGAITILFTYLIARELVPDEPGVPLLAMALHAFLPMFVFVSASVNNDNLTYMISAVGLLLILRAARRPLRLHELVLLGVVLGLAALSKLSTLALLPVTGLALGISHWHANPMHERLDIRRALGGWLRDMGVLIVPAVLIAGWWYLRNVMLYGDPTGLKVLNTFIEGRNHTPWWQVLSGEWEGFRINFWGLFGGVNVLMQPPWIYQLLDVLTLLALVGLAAWAVGRLRRHAPTRWLELGLAVLYVVLLTVGVARYTLSTPATQGRLIFPALGAIMTLFALGFTGWAPRKWRPLLGAAPASLLFVLTLSAPFTVIRAAYAPPLTLARNALPVGMQTFGVTFNGEITLLGFELGKTRLHEGEELPVTLYWQAVKRPAENYSLSIKVFGRNDEVLGQLDVYPGRGTLPTTAWPLDRVIVDTFRVPVLADGTGPVGARVDAGLYRYQDRKPLPATDPKGNPVGNPTLGLVKVYGKSKPAAPDVPLDAQFGASTRLAGYDLGGYNSIAGALPGQELSLNLHWSVVGPFEQDYSVFVQVLDGDGKAVAYGDGPPLDGTYPTSLWDAGEYLLDRHTVKLPADLPPGAYRVIVGLYDPPSGRRVPVVDGAGKVLGDAARGIEIKVAGP